MSAGGAQAWGMVEAQQAIEEEEQNIEEEAFEAVEEEHAI